MTPSQLEEDSEDFENPFTYFVEAVEVLSHQAELQCNEMGNYNTPWEIQDNFLGRSAEVLGFSSSYLNSEQRARIVELAYLVEHLPKDALGSKTMLMTTHAGCIEAMHHQAWMPLREYAARLLKELEPAISRNNAFFAAKRGL
jgi:hypothetical protein